MTTATPNKETPTVTEQHKFLDHAKRYQFDRVRALVADNPEYVNCRPAGRWSALHQAADVDDGPTVRFLVKHGADVSAKTNDGRTPLDLAKSATVRTLLNEAVAQGGSDGEACMYMESPMDALQLSNESGGWETDGFTLADCAVVHSDLYDAPVAAREVAQRMDSALDGATLPASESDTRGRVVVITGAGESGIPEAKMLLEALGLKKSVDDGRVVPLDEANVSAKDYSRGSLSVVGFCNEGEYDDVDEDDDDRTKILATTAIMAAELNDHFELDFSDKIVCAPMLYGGRASDGNVVAVLSMRVWT